MRPYLELSKLRILLMVLLTAALGFWLAGGRSRALLVWTLAGTALSAAASGALNQLLERDQDGLMRRTRTRPLPEGRVKPSQALAYGLACAVLGVGLLAWKVNLSASGLAAFTIASYVLAYTPLKRITPQSTWVGAVAGAMPPLIGWAAAAGGLSSRAWALFAIQFLWQIPHFLAIFWMHRDDYAAAGFRVMPVVDPGGRSTACQIALHSFALLPASLMPTLCGLAGFQYGLAAFLLGLLFLGLGMRASWTMTVCDTRRLFLASLLYLPVLFGTLAATSALPLSARENAVLPPSYGEAPDFNLKSQDGRPMRRSDLAGAPWVADFIYTRCGGQCPIMTAKMSALSRRLPGVRLVSFSVDSFDTPRILSRYAEAHRAEWLFLTGRPGEVRALCKEGFKLAVADGRDPREPIIHSKMLVLVDSRGMIRGYFDADDGASLEELVRYAGKL